MYAETHANAYRRIESVAEALGKLRVLDLTIEEVRQAIASAKDAAGLFEPERWRGTTDSLGPCLPRCDCRS